MVSVYRFVSISFRKLLFVAFMLTCVLLNLKPSRAVALKLTEAPGFRKMCCSVDSNLVYVIETDLEASIDGLVYAIAVTRTVEDRMTVMKIMKNEAVGFFNFSPCELPRVQSHV